MSRMVNLDTEISRIVDAGRPNIRTARAVLTNIDDFLNWRDEGLDAGDIVSELADAIDAYDDASDVDERADAWEDIAIAAQAIPDAIEEALDDIACAEAEWTPISIEAAPVYRCAECSAVMIDTDASISILCIACNTAPDVHRAYSGADGCDDTGCAICHPAPVPISIEAAPRFDEVQCAQVAPTEWLPTRRGLLGVCKVRTSRPGSTATPYITWVWLTENGDTGEVRGEPGRAMAITDAYVAMVRSGTGDAL